MTFTICTADQRSRPDVERLRWLFILEGGSVVWNNPPFGRQMLAGRYAGSIWTSSSRSYCHIQVDGRKYKRSHIVFAMTRGHWPVEQIDHINGDSLDDRPSNLREATQTENARNRRKRKSSTVPMGVRISKNGRYVARIRVNNEYITLGTYDTIQEAEAVYRSARLEHFGEFA